MRATSRSEHRGPSDAMYPVKSRSIVSDIRHFILRRPAIATLIEFASDEERENYCYRMMQRLGISVTEYSILNVHRIGIEAPVRYVFEELLRWDGDSTCWPNHIATVERIDGRLEHIEIRLFGKMRSVLHMRQGLLGHRFKPLFDLKALKVQHQPDKSDFDNARYLLYECGGGYPIGFFAIYARSSIAEEGEREPTQLFFGVGFNFYGKEDWSGIRVISTMWQTLHNRVTANIMNRLKHLCEANFQRIVEGSKPLEGSNRPGTPVRNP